VAVTESRLGDGAHRARACFEWRLFERGGPAARVLEHDIHAREPFRSRSVITAVAIGMICGFGAQGYELALRGLVETLRTRAPA
jgi:hypothetical protein